MPRKCRTPHGVRGLKCQCADGRRPRPKSHPAWGAWIEISRELIIMLLQSRRTPYGVRGLKFALNVETLLTLGVAPRMGCVD